MGSKGQKERGLIGFRLGMASLVFLMELVVFVWMDDEE